jgi:hypothetical protein
LKPLLGGVWGGFKRMYFERIGLHTPYLKRENMEDCFPSLEGIKGWV